MARQKKQTDKESVDLGVMDMTTAAVIPNVDTDETVGFWHARGLDIPKRETEFSAGFDLKASLEVGKEVHYYDHSNNKRSKSIRGDSDSGGRLIIEPGERVLVPTDLYADIPMGYYIAIHPRSGTSWKQGLKLTNSVGVVDADYVEEIKVSITNDSGVRVVIEDGERIAQGVLMPCLDNELARLNKKPKQKTSRKGGFGSTGKK